MFIDRAVGLMFIGLARALTGAYAFWTGCAPDQTQRLYYANHASHMDFLLLWAMLPPAIRYRTRPVAGADYWQASAIKRYLIHRVFRGVLVERNSGATNQEKRDPLAPLHEAIAAGDSLIFFPEGTRTMTDDMLPFKSGLYHLACQHPDLELIPVYIANLNRVMPKGNLIPVPVVCSLNFGAACRIAAGEEKASFLARAQQCLRDLSKATEA